MRRHSRPYRRLSLAIAPSCVLAVATLALGALACGESSSEPNRPSAPIEALPRSLTTAELAVRDAANAFSFALWRQLNEAQADANVFVSPLSASFALGMTMNGAAHETLDQMRTALQVGGTPLADVNAGYQSLMALLTSLDPTVTTTIANSIWYRHDFAFHQQFFDTVRSYFSAEVTGLDFANQTASVGAINSWVRDQTAGKIPTILDRINGDAVMFLINAIYFKANWREKFDPARTTTETFHARGGASQSAHLMQRTDTMRYAEGATWQAVDLPYGNTAYSMTVVLPAEGMDASAFASGMTLDSWNGLVASLTYREVQLSFPKLSLTYERTLNDDLRTLGMHVPFEAGAADFTGMSPAGRDLFITSVKQKAFVDIDEAGTEAGAATIVEVGVTSAPIVTTMRVDRPYVFVIRERLTGTVLFMGKVVAMPTAE